MIENRFRTRSATAVLLACLAFGAAALAAEVVEAEAETVEQETGLWETIQQLYDKAKAAGEDVPENVYQWAKEDVASIGDWEYRIVTMGTAAGDGPVEDRLNKLGRERWECFFLERDEDEIRLYLKRPRRSYISSIPFSDLMKLLPGELGGGAGE